MQNHFTILYEKQRIIQVKDVHSTTANINE